LIKSQRADLKAGEEYCKNRIKFFNIFEKFEIFSSFSKNEAEEESPPLT